ncbi:MAG: radical SAM protein [Candidatus Omnitrophota bacterium]|nr:radical SAM protein [Candidatus Omnitrophota bacterium]MBU1929412.1 radical SAM protein [Candidatus Omnitrophota bacterium]MBU2034287.1 radical SAM protein [Candidatus Omnitrophota bacterium]MBU2221851.1 radical SAM protein [Candidatus Omnitrophota bacterium]
MDKRRLQLLKMIFSRMRYVWHFLLKGKFKMAYNHIWVGLFTRDSGIALWDSMYRLFSFIRPYPETIEIEVTTRCHLRCAICEHTYWKEPARDMSFEEFKKIIDQFPRLKWAGPSGIGSGFLNKDYLKMLEYLKKRSVFVEFFDSFDLIDKETAEKLVDLEIDKIWVSLDDPTPDGYARIRVGTNLEKILNNIRVMLNTKEKKRSPFPEIWFQMIVTSINVHKMPEYVELVHDLTKDKKYNYANLIFWTNILSFKEVQGLSTGIPDEIRREVLIRARKHNIFINWNENIQPVNPPSCCARWNEPFILVTGHVQPCCIINQANQRDHQKLYSFGNLLEQDFHDIWRSEKLKGFLKTLKNNRFPIICKYCRMYIPDKRD